VDNIALNNISVGPGPTNIRTLAGNDFLTIQNSSFSSSNVTADMGADDDTVTLNNNSFQVGPPHLDLFDGGSGSNDSIGGSGNSGLNVAVEIVNFESVAGTLP
jgi:hypothetical protein